MAEAKKAQFGVLSGTFAYAKIAQSSQKYQSKDMEYSIDVIVPKAEAKAWNKKFPKQKAKEYEQAEFEQKFKMESPFPDEDEVFVIKLKKAATKDGEAFDEKFRPKVLLDSADGERTDITVSRLISNGSKGQVSYRIVDNDFGTFAQLQNVLMDEEGFIEYEANTYEAGSEFGENKPVKKEPENKAVTEGRKSKQEKKQAAESSDEDDSSPF